MLSRRLISEGGELKTNRKGTLYIELFGDPIAKECSICLEMELMENFHKKKDGGFGRDTRCKKCAQKRKKRYYLENREEILEKGAEYRKENREKVLERHRKYKRENRELIRERGKLYREKNRDKMRERRKGYYQRNKTYYAKWRSENKEKIAAWTARRRARKRGLPDDLTSEEFEGIKEIFGGNCALSGKADEVTIDHFIPLKTGKGGTIKENVIPLSISLNSSKKDSNPFEWIKTREDISNEKFDNVVKYLADLNGMTVGQYKEYVYKCFEGVE